MGAFNDRDAAFMRRALALAKRGLGRVEPNPMVGCVIVRNDKIIGEGYHRRFGGPHAEVDALRRCGASAKGAAAYVTLEPCCFHGKTPPCSEALIAAGVRRVVAAMEDPHERVSGKGAARLRKAGIKVDIGLLVDQAGELAAPYVKLVTKKRPWVILKWAQSLDGKIATRTGDSKWISDQACRAHAHRTRGRVDAVVVGVGTVIADDPMLTCRACKPKRIATRIVLDGNLRTPRTARLVRTARQTPTWIFCGKDAPRSRVAPLEKSGCVIHRVRAGKRGVSLIAVLNALGRAQMANVLVEGGGRVLGAFHDAQLADEYHIYVAPILIGGREAPGPLHALGPKSIEECAILASKLTTQRLGNGRLIQIRATR